MNRKIILVLKIIILCLWCFLLGLPSMIPFTAEIIKRLNLVEEFCKNVNRKSVRIRKGK